MGCSTVRIVGAYLLAETDHQHFLDAAAQRASKVSVRLDPVEDYDPIGSKRGKTEDDVEAVKSSADLSHLHARFDGDAHAFGGNSVARQHLDLTRRGGSAVAAHGGHDEGTRACLDKDTQGGLHNLLEVGDAAAANAKSDFHARLDLFPQPGLRELIFEKAGKIQFFRGWKALFHLQHLGKVIGYVHSGKNPLIVLNQQYTRGVAGSWIARVTPS